MKQISPKSVPLALAAVTVLAYGLLLPLTGFYWDDWPFAWLARFMGPSTFIPAFRGFRPFLGPIFYLTTSLLPPIPWLWQLAALLVRFASALAAWFALAQVWPAHRREVLVACLLFLVFPGYSQHWVALTHINQEWIPFVCYLLSFGFTARAVRQAALGTRSAWRPTALALLLTLAGLLPTEYFVGLEPLRLLFIWVMVSEQARAFRPRLVQSFKHWWPYLLLWLADAGWLAYYYRSGAYISYDLTAVRAAPSLGQALSAFGEALWKAGAYVWVQVVVLCAQLGPAPVSLLTLALIAATFAAAAWYLTKVSLVPGERGGFALPAVLIGLAGILLGRVPSFAAGLPLTLQSSYDRFMISMMLGGSLFVAGLLALIPRARLQTLLAAALIALGIGQQFFNANIFRRDWERQRQIYWQMAWRMPALEPGTALITQQMPLDYETDYSMTAAVNWIYAPAPHPASLPYALIYSEKRLGGVALPDLQPGTAMQLPYRTVDFRGSTSQVVVIYVAPNGCLRVLDPALEDAETYAKFPDSVTAPIALSEPARIRINAAQPLLPAEIFGAEPRHDWCYFYEKAELARQAGEWQQITRLEAEARQGGYAPQDAFEWLPFIEGSARADELRSAEQLSQRAWQQEPRVHRGLCVLWGRVQANGPSGAQALASRLRAQYGCAH